MENSIDLKKLVKIHHNLLVVYDDLVNLRDMFYETDNDLEDFILDFCDSIEMKIEDLGGVLQEYIETLKIKKEKDNASI